MKTLLISAGFAIVIATAAGCAQDGTHAGGDGKMACCAKKETTKAADAKCEMCEKMDAKTAPATQPADHAGHH